MSTAVETALEKIRQAILSGRFAPGQHLKESELVRFCGVSRTPVRSALNRLAADDLLDLHRNRGARVKVWPAAEIDDLFELRALLEGHAAAKAARRVSTEQLLDMENAIVSMNQVLRSGASRQNKIDEFLRLNAQVHQLIWAASGSERLVAILNRLVEQAVQVRTAASYSLARVAESHHQHKELWQALKVGDALWAEAIMRSHIRHAHTSLVDAG